MCVWEYICRNHLVLSWWHFLVNWHSCWRGGVGLCVWMKLFRRRPRAPPQVALLHQNVCLEFLWQLLVGEEGFRLSAGGVGAQRTAQGQLTGTWLVGLQVGLDQVCQGLNEINEYQQSDKYVQTLPHRLGLNITSKQMAVVSILILKAKRK